MDPSVLAPSSPSVRHAPAPPAQPVRRVYLRAVWAMSFGLLVGVAAMVAVHLFPARFFDDDLLVDEKLWSWAGLAAGVALLAAMWRWRRGLQAVSPWRWVMWLFVLAAAGRAAVLLTIPYVPSDDFIVYHQSGIGLAKHGGMTVNASAAAGYPCFFPPGQIYTLGALYKLFGDQALRKLPPAGSNETVTPEQWAAYYRAARVGAWWNVLLGSLTAVGVYGIARRVTGEFPGRVAGVLTAVVPSGLFATFTLGAEVGQTFWIVLAFYAYARWVDACGEGVSPSCPAGILPARGGEAGVTSSGVQVHGAHNAGETPATRLAASLLVGLCLGMASLFRPTFAPVAGLLAVHLLLTAADKRRALLAGAAMLAATAAVIAPWTVRNYVVTGGAFIPISSNGGGNLYSGNNPWARGNYTTQAWEELYTQARDDEKINRLGMEKATRWIRENPRRFAELAAVKFALFWGTDRDMAWWVLEAPTRFHQAHWAPPGYGHTEISTTAQRAGEGISTGVYLSVLAAAAVGLWRWRWMLRTRPGWATIMLLAGFLTAVHMVFESQAKYHYTLVPLLCVLAGTVLSPQARRPLTATSDT